MARTPPFRVIVMRDRDDATGVSRRRVRRAISTTLDYTLTLGVATLVITVLFVGVGDFVSDRRDQVIRTELEVIGQHVARDIESVDRLARAGAGADDVILNRSLPSRVTGSVYTITVTTSGGDTVLVLETVQPEIGIEIQLSTRTDVATTSINGGDYRVSYDPSSDEIEVKP